MKIHLSHIISFTFFLVVSLFQQISVFAQNQNKVMTIYVPFPSGGASEQLANIIGNKLEKKINQRVVVRTNNDSNISATEFVNQIKSLPNDGYHLIMGNLGTFASSVAINKNSVLYDPLTDFEAVAMLGKTPMYLVARADFPAQNFKQFIQYLRQNKHKKFTIAHAGKDSTSYFAGFYFAAILKLNLTYVPYSGSDLALKDISNGYIDMMIDQTTSSLSYIRSNLVKPLLITSKKPSQLTPRTPCSRQVDLHEFNINGWNMLFVPKGISQRRLNQLNQIITDVLSDKFVQADFRLLNTIIFDKYQNTPTTLKIFLQKEIDYWQEITRIIKKNIAL